MAHDDNAPVIIKKVVKKHGHGHHGGSWKIAYADFVTAMMAFFLLLWLLSNTTDEQKEGIADYFSPSTPSESTSGAGGVLGGQSVVNDGARSSGSVMLDTNRPVPTKIQSDNDSDDSDAASAAEKLIAKREESRFQKAQEDLKTKLQSIPDIRNLANHLIIDITEEGMRIQIVDSEDRSMFHKGNAELFNHARRILEKVADVVLELPNRITVAGHTDAGNIALEDYSNWELSADRANAARRVLSANGVAADRFFEVTGKADTEPLFPEDPGRPANRRVTIVLKREAPVLPRDYIQ